MTHISPFFGVLVALPIALLGQQRDARVNPVGTSEISGVVLSADATPQPIRRAVVSVASAELPNTLSVITDDAGRFVFARLPAGTFTVTAKKAAYLPAEFGSPRPGRAGSRVALAEGERRAVSVTMFRGAVIAGTLRDATGLPVGGVTVVALDARAAAGTGPNPAPETAVTDDRGSYRIYGLMPGEYVISASIVPGGSGDVGARSSAELDATLSTLAQRQNRTTPTGAAAPPLPRVPTPAPIGYAPLYFPGTPFFSDAARIRIGAGEERDGVSFEVSHVAVGSIEGTVVGGVTNLTTVMLALIPDGPRTSGPIGNIGSAGAISSQPPNAQGEFKYGNLPPGRYRIVARARIGAGDPNALPPGTILNGVPVGGRVGGGAPPAGAPSQPTGEMLYGVADVEVRGQNVNGVTVALQPGGTLAGRVVFDAGATPLPADLTTIRVNTTLVGGSYSSQMGSTRIGNALSSVPPVSLNADGTFVITGIGPGIYAANCQMPANLTSIWKLRSAVVDGRDLLDFPLEGPAVQLAGAVFTVSDKRTELAGSLQTPSGQPASEYYVVAFSTNRSLWRQGSRRSATTRPATDGRFVFADLPAGEYYLAALTDVDPAEWQEAAFLEQVAPAAIKVSLAEGEKKVQNLRIR